METGRTTARRESLVELSGELRTHATATRNMRSTVSKVPPDELSKSDLLTLRAGYMKQLEQQERLVNKIASLLDKILDSI